MDWIFYYKDQGETDAQILDLIRPFQPHSERYSIRTVEPHGQYKVINESRYTNDDKALTLEFRELEGPNGYIICSESITQKQFLPDESNVRKWFHNEEIYSNFMIEVGCEDPNFLVFVGDYYPDGSLDQISYNPGSTYDTENFSSADYKELVHKCNLTTEQADYYFKADFLPVLPT